MSLNPTLLKSNIYLFIFLFFFFLEGRLAEKPGLQQQQQEKYTNHGFSRLANNLILRIRIVIQHCGAEHHTPLGQFCSQAVF